MQLILSDFASRQGQKNGLFARQYPPAAKAILAKDWDDLEAAGVTHKDMAKARAWVRE